MKKPDFRKLLFVALSAVSLFLVVVSFLTLFSDVRQSQYYSHIVLIPFVSAWLIYRDRKEIFPTRSNPSWKGLPLMAVATALFIFGSSEPLSLNDKASAFGSAALIFWWGSYLLAFGEASVRKALFPFAFLLFMVPVPDLLMQKTVALLTSGSTEATGFFFRSLRVPFFQEGPVFRLPGFDIEVARECSGIRSSLALLVTCVLAGHLFLGRFWKQVVFVLSVFPVAIFKNGVRIVTLYLLSYFVDMRIIEGGFLHRSGGFIFFGLGLATLGVILWLLKRSDGRAAGPPRKKNS